MNIFYLDNNQEECVKYYVDVHVVKMFVETVQMLSTSHHVVDGFSEDIPCLPVRNINHPCCIWARESIENYMWLVKLGFALAQEYSFRYNKERNTLWKLEWLDQNHPDIEKWDFTDPPLCIGDNKNCIVEGDLISSYRNFYKGPKKIQLEKNNYVKWKNRESPKWFSS